MSKSNTIEFLDSRFSGKSASVITNELRTIGDSEQMVEGIKYVGGYCYDAGRRDTLLVSGVVYGLVTALSFAGVGIYNAIQKRREKHIIDSSDEADKEGDSEK